MPATELDQIVNLCKRRGFVYPSAEIYGGFRSTYDYGPLGVADAAQRQGRVGPRDGAGARRRRADRRRDPRPAAGLGGQRPPRQLHRPARRLHELQASASALDKLDDPNTCPNCGKHGTFTEARAVQPDVQDPRRPGRGRRRRGLPAPGDGAGHVRQLRQRAADDAQEAAVRHRPGRQELPQRDHAAELHLPHPRVRADGDGVLRAARPTAPQWYEYWCNERLDWYVAPRHPRRACCACAPHDADELSHYSAGTSDVEFLFPWGWGELEGIAQRTDYDLKAARRSTRASGSTTSTRRRTSATCPYVIEPAAGATRTMAAFLLAGLRRGRGQRRGRARCCACTRASRRTRWPCCRCRRRTR